jgi:hypothetical protein
LRWRGTDGRTTFLSRTKEFNRSLFIFFFGNFFLLFCSRAHLRCTQQRRRLIGSFFYFFIVEMLDILHMHQDIFHVIWSLAVCCRLAVFLSLVLTRGNQFQDIYNIPEKKTMEKKKFVWLETVPFFFFFSSSQNRSASTIAGSTRPPCSCSFIRFFSQPFLHFHSTAIEIAFVWDGNN